ncbi:protein GVQW3-like [Centruroides vittatus]|uniref:protein GVQW3-like n=1 Tax=Centruroides vittatus TaxID=120091 RepID=UPI0035106D0C
MDEVLGESAPSYTIVEKWTALFKSGRESVEDDPRSGRPSTAVTEENIDKVHDLVLADYRLKTCEIAETTGISVNRVYYILTENLGMTKVSARRVPRLLTAEQKRVRTLMSKECLVFYQKNPQDFMRQFVTTNETWVHYYTPETKEQSKQWKHHSSPSPKKAKTVPSARESDGLDFLGC